MDAPSSSQAGPPPFRVDVTPDGDALRVVPAGELDVATVEELGRELRDLHERGVTRVVLDLRRLTFVDSTGMRLIVRLHETLGQDGVDFRLVAGSDAVHRIFELCELVSVLPFDGREDGARGGSPQGLAP